MCGIIGYVGGRPCRELILTGLERLEYRGYDSAGFALIDEGHGVVESVRAVGNLAELRAAAGEGNGNGATAGLGHTRWATHGRVTTANAHPHASADGSVLVVMNGIIENYLELRTELQNAGVVFASDTDTEVVPQLIARAYDGDLAAAVRAVLPRLGGHFAFVAAHVAEPGPAGGGAPRVPAGDRRGRRRALRRLGDPGLPQRDPRRRADRGRRGRGPRRRRPRDLAGRGAPAGAPAEPRRLGRGRRREGRLRVVHAQGDPRAAGRPLGHDRRPPAAATDRSSSTASASTTPRWRGSSGSTSSPAAPRTTRASSAGTSSRTGRACRCTSRWPRSTATAPASPARATWCSASPRAARPPTRWRPCASPASAAPTSSRSPTSWARRPRATPTASSTPAPASRSASPPPRPTPPRSWPSRCWP